MFEAFLAQQLTRRKFIEKSIKTVGGIVMFGFPAEAQGSFVFAHGYKGGPDNEIFEALGEQVWNRYRFVSYFPALPLGRDKSDEFPEGLLPNPNDAIEQFADVLMRVPEPKIGGGISYGAYVAARVASLKRRSMNGFITAAMRYKDPNMGAHPLSDSYEWNLISRDNIRANNSGEWVHMHAENDKTVPYYFNAIRIRDQLGARLITDKTEEHYEKPQHGVLIANRIGQYLIPAIT